MDSQDIELIDSYRCLGNLFKEYAKKGEYLFLSIENLNEREKFNLKTLEELLKEGITNIYQQEIFDLC